MMYAIQHPLIGQSQINLITGQTDAAPVFTPGAMVDAVDNYWGFGRFIYGQANATLTAFSLCEVTPTLSGSAPYQYQPLVTATPNSGNLGLMTLVALQAMTAGQWGWFQIAGTVPVWCNASIAAGSKIGLVAAGQGGANSASKNIVGAVVVAPATTTVVKANCFSQQTSQIVAPNTDGLFVGCALSGTGVGASALIKSIQTDMRSIVPSVANSAAISGSVTATYNDGTNYFNLVFLGDGVCYQGPIT